MAAGPSASASEPGIGTGQLSAWEQLKAKILQAIKNDAEPDVFEARFAEVRNCIEELKRTGKLAEISIELQEDGAVFF